MNALWGFDFLYFIIAKVNISRIAGEQILLAAIPKTELCIQKPCRRIIGYRVQPNGFFALFFGVKEQFLHKALADALPLAIRVYGKKMHHAHIVVSEIG